MKIHVGQVKTVRAVVARSQANSVGTAEAAGTIGKLARKVRQEVTERGGKLLKKLGRKGKKDVGVVTLPRSGPKALPAPSAPKALPKPTGTDMVPLEGKLMPRSGGSRALTKLPPKVSSFSRRLAEAIAKSAMDTLFGMGKQLKGVDPTGVFLFAGIAGATLSASLVASRFYKRVNYLDKNDGKPPAPYVNPSAYLADAYPLQLLNRKMNLSTLEKVFKSKQFKQIEGKLGKEQVEKLKELLQKRVNRTPDRHMSVSDTFAAMETVKAMAKKEDLQIADVDSMIVDGFAKAHKQIDKWGLRIVDDLIKG